MRFKAVRGCSVKRLPASPHSSEGRRPDDEQGANEDRQRAFVRELVFVSQEEQPCQSAPWAVSRLDERRFGAIASSEHALNGMKPLNGFPNLAEKALGLCAESPRRLVMLFSGSERLRLRDRSPGGKMGLRNQL